MYNCKYCGKECKSKLSKSCHERLCKRNPNKIDTSYLTQNAINTINKIRENHINNKKSLKIIKFKRICEYCGKEFYIDGYENRKHFPKCCSSVCAHRLSASKNHNGTKICKCTKCNKEFEINKHADPNKFICVACKKEINGRHIYQKSLNIIKNNACKIISSNKVKVRKKRVLTEETIQKLREAGKKSAARQSELRRSKNEIKFCNLCESYFKNVRHNEPIFNGWDADVILPDIKFAILWNGKVHYEPIFGIANYNRVINRDKIKLKEIEKTGYKFYIIKDIGKYNENFVEEKFNEFIKFLKENNYII